MEYNTWIKIGDNTEVMHLGAIGLIRTKIISNLGVSVSMIEIDHQTATMLIKDAKK